ncbi:hypothetical protein L873DRAFT_1825967 [Choiromyces venosus 120613-1]|uniref:Phytanoyl-CoA dioxygenase n=1 Tax=Choiromyces venosus 120613-1 TaxID=1336337 RepID=A0A3N4K2D3_9PEZI|nr:hypothetical protein L873DRAFT_1825967 [Choiromyces venosus 120613-1]
MSPPAQLYFSITHSFQLSSIPLTITPSEEEARAGRLTPQNLELAIRSLHVDGLVVVENVIERSKLDYLNTKMVSDAYELANRDDDSPFNYNKGPPPTKPYFDPSIFLNPIATQITSTHLGPKPKYTFLSGNTALPPTPASPPLAQPTHSDADFAHPSYPFSLIINVPLVDMTPKSGATEIWLGTHTYDISVQEGAHGERASGRVKKEPLEERRGVRPLVQAVVEKGSIVVRDLRLWHGGMPNLGNVPRVMIAMIHFAPWFRNPMKLELSEDVKSVVEGFGKDLEVPVTWKNEQVVEKEYLNRGFGNSYFFDQLE